VVHILITGCNGQLGSEFKAIAKNFPLFSFTFTDFDELDITDNNQVDTFIHEIEPDVIINCAGYTAVDKAEDEPEQAMWLNRDGVANLTRACDKYDCYLVHISTDYIFDGKNSRPYREDDIPSPVSVYGLSKLAGEEAMMSCLQKGLIIRTSWLYSSFGNNFVKTILKRCAEKGELSMVSDQFGTPTYARDLAKAILDLLPAAMNSPRFEILNYSNEGKCSWFDFAREVFAIAGPPCRINPVNTDSYPAKAKRPAYSVLDKSLIRKQFGISIPKWQDSLRECLGEMGIGRRA
jgi:dTDP-4-dehydrorhamnose reductase